MLRLARAIEPHLRAALLPALAVALAGGCQVAATYRSVAGPDDRVDSEVWFWFGLMVIFPLVAFSLLAVVLGPALLLFAGTRRAGGHAIAIGTISLVILLATGDLTDRAWTHGIERAVQRSRAVTDAIERFERERGGPPKQLADLVPDYLDQVPHTGMARYPAYEYLHPATRGWPTEFDDAWALWIPTDTFPLTPSGLYFVPSKRYPRPTYDREVKQIGDWALISVED
jgi:hypothetical protein